MTYDLRRLRLKGLIHRIPKTHRYTATSYGLKVAFFYAKLYLRDPSAELGRAAPRRRLLARARFAPPSTNSTPKFRNSTRRPPLPPEKLASTRKISRLESV